MSTKRIFCGLLFWIKVFIALSYSLAILSYFSYDVYTKYTLGVAPKILINKDDPSCSAAKSTRARLEPQDGKLLFGFHLDWSIDTPLIINKRVGRKYAVYNAFYILDTTVNPPFPRDMINWHAQEISKLGNGGMFEISIDPVVPWEDISDKVWDDFAILMRDINAKYGIPIFLRLAHEMNGNWVINGLRPLQFIEGFRKCTSFVRSHTNLTAMVWGPNLGTQYPFGANFDTVNGLPSPSIPNEVDEFHALDTNNDGVIDNKDDPYTPYYPGDDVVDWVALSLYHFPTISEGNFNPRPDEFYEELTGTMNPDFNLGANFEVRNFYKRFAEDRNKPLMIPESGSPWLYDAPTGPITAAAGATTLSVKREWWKQVLTPTTLKRLPKLKAYLNFEEIKKLPVFTQDFSITFSQENLDAFNEDMTQAIKDGVDIVTVDDVRFDCAGQLIFK